MNTAILLPLPAPVRWSAAASGVIGLIANAFLILFLVTAQPWTDAPDDGWFGWANDVLIVVQFAALLPVILALGRLMAGDVRARAWTWIGLAAAVAVIILQVLLVTGTLPFATQIVPVSVSVVVAMCWAGAISTAGTRTRTLPATVTRLGRTNLIILPIAVVAYGVGALVTGVLDVPWAWAAGGIPGVVLWTLFPAWTLLLGLKR
ncbi:hypothetical protein [Nonomuraea basaltis]|uniref:hypothetical protein n=1 Tax=Nonomuraea basaltis TaxID=2495887 RepID=UPI00110C6CB9|nr:hypothetical protein [Nonomuraea basaltis]TMR95858.1 hypothetical protein EJK15_26200 [Nonomuraea basaltis]